MPARTIEHGDYLNIGGVVVTFLVSPRGRLRAYGPDGVEFGKLSPEEMPKESRRRQRRKRSRLDRRGRNRQQ